MIESLLLFCLCLANGEREVSDPAAAAAPSLKLPPQVIVQPGARFRIVAETNAKNLRWTTESAFDRIPSEWLADPIKHYAGRAPQVAGTYAIKAVGTVNDIWVESECLIVVGVNPGPAPGPTPVPTPNDPLFADLNRIYLADTSPTKLADVKRLAQVYRDGANMVKTSQRIKTSEQLFDVLREVSTAAIGSNLKSLREAITPEVAKCFDAGDLDEADRVKGSVCFLRIATLLEGLR